MAANSVPAGTETSWTPVRVTSFSGEPPDSLWVSTFARALVPGANFTRICPATKWPPRAVCAEGRAANTTGTSRTATMALLRRIRGSSGVGAWVTAPLFFTRGPDRRDVGAPDVLRGRCRKSSNSAATSAVQGFAHNCSRPRRLTIAVQEESRKDLTDIDLTSSKQ